MAIPIRRMKHPDKTTTPPGGYRYTQPETGVNFHFFTWHQMLEEVGKHRLANALDTTWDWDQRLENDVCLQNLIPCRDDEIAAPEDSPIVVAGRILWSALHAFASQYPENPTESDKSNSRYWMSDWASKIPQFGCNCRSEWTRLIAGFPPDYGSREAFYRWSVVSHDWVNRKLNKPLFHPDWFAASPAKDI